MMNPKPDKMIPAVYGGILMGLVSTIPFVSLINCFCCAGILLGGFVAVFFYKNNHTPDSPPMTSGDCMLVGVFAGIVGAFVGAILGTAIIAAFGNIMGDFMVGMIRKYGIEVPEQSLRTLESSATEGPSVRGFFIQLFSNLVLYDIFGLLGGLIGYSVFRPKQPVMMPPPPAPRT